MTKEELTLEVIARLKKEYPLAVCTLDYNDAWKLLVSVRLAAQCTDARVNVVVKDLYAMLEEQEGPTAAFVESVNENVTNWLYNHIRGFDRSVAEYRFMRDNESRI